MSGFQTVRILKFCWTSGPDVMSSRALQKSQLFAKRWQHVTPLTTLYIIAQFCWLKDWFCILFFHPRTCLRTSLQCFDLDSCCPLVSSLVYARQLSQLQHSTVFDNFYHDFKKAWIQFSVKDSNWSGLIHDWHRIHRQCGFDLECPKTWKNLKPAPPWTFGFF